MPLDYAYKLADLLYRPFYGSAFRQNLPLGGDPIKISFSELNGSFRFVREGQAVGVRVFQGLWTATANGVNSEGIYNCDDATSGTYRAGNLQVNGLGVYSGSLSMKPNGGGSSILEEHAAYDRSFGTPF
ncbi:MAG: hypothetical protein AB7L76_25100 [Burkholderiaceae bacterium]